MPLVYQQNINLHSKLGLWHISEPESFFEYRNIVSPEVRHPHKRLQTLAGRLLLTELEPGFPLEKVLIATTRKPFLESEAYHFSISHCDDYAAAIISTNEQVGIDIEVPQEKILRLVHKFLSDAEQEIVMDEKPKDILRVTMAWCMKEAAYKWYGAGKVDFIMNMPLTGFSFVGDRYKGTISFRKEIETVLHVHGIIINGNCLAWVCN